MMSCSATVTVNLGEHPAIGPLVETVQCMRETQCEFSHFGWFKSYTANTSITWDDEYTGHTFEVVGSQFTGGSIDYVLREVSTP
jgi:hypothetical protein